VSQYPFPSSRLWSTLSTIDRAIAADVRDLGCPHCAGTLHLARYPRKPRGVPREVLGEAYTSRESFCCRDCRRRTTPPSLRFLGRKVYLGALLIVFGNVAGSGSSVALALRRLAATTAIPLRTLARWRAWWTGTLPSSAWWRECSASFIPPVISAELPLALLARVAGRGLHERLCTVLALCSPLSTLTCSHFPRVVVGTQKMP